MIAHFEGLIKTNNFVPHQFCSKTNITPPGVEKPRSKGAISGKFIFFAILTNLQVKYLNETYRIDESGMGKVL